MMTSCRRHFPALLLALGGSIQSIQGQLVDPEFIDRPWINEFHYDNRGTDINEFIEVAAPEDLDVSTYRVVLYNGFYGYMYEEDAMHPLTTFEEGDTVNGVTFYYKPLPPQNCSSASKWCGLQNGKDGFALANYFTESSGRVVEFISYEGTFTAKNGPAENMTTLDIGVQQLTTTPIGHSVSKTGIGCNPNEFTWELSTMESMGTVNYNQTTTCAVVFINEFHYNNENNGEGQFIEVASNVEDVSTYSVVLYSGEDGLPYDAVLLSSFEAGDTTEDGLTFYYYDFPSAGGTVGLENDPMMVNGTEGPIKAGMALVNNDETVLEFISYGGSFEALDGVALGMMATDVGVKETTMTPVGSSIQLTDGEGCSSRDFEWEVVQSSQVDLAPMGDTRGSVNIGQDILCYVEPVNTTSVGEAPAVEPEEDDLVGQDDDFLDDTVVVFTANQRINYAEGKDHRLYIEDGE